MQITDIQHHNRATIDPERWCSEGTGTVNDKSCRTDFSRIQLLQKIIELLFVLEIEFLVDVFAVGRYCVNA